VGFLAAVTELFTDAVQAFGYPGIFVAMLIEGVITPIPSEMILPFAGYLARLGVLSLPLVILVASVAAMIGSGGAYYLGLRFGRPLFELASRVTSMIPRTHHLVDIGLDWVRQSPGPSLAVLEGLLSSLFGPAEEASATSLMSPAPLLFATKNGV